MICPTCKGTGANDLTGIPLRQQLRLGRKRLGLSLREVEEVTGIKAATLCQYEHGKVMNPSFPLLMKLGKLYGVAACEWSELI